MKNLTVATCGLAAVLMLGLSVVLPSGDALAQATEIKKGVSDIQGDKVAPEMKVVIKTIINVLLYFIGALSVIMIIYGGFRYVTSGGDSAGVTSAKSTIMYAVIGLVIAILAFSIVNYVLGVFK